MTTYMILDGDGDKNTDGVQQYAVERIAQRIADQRGEAVWVYGPGDTDATAERVDLIDG
jgi:hypothetical protein